MKKFHPLVLMVLFIFLSCMRTFAANPTERDAKAYEIFEEIFIITYTSENIQAELPKVEALYMKIIREYPDTALAQESYWRLISLYIEKSIPPEYEKAENLYKEFLTRITKGY